MFIKALMLSMMLLTASDDQLIYGYTNGEPFMFLVSPIYLLDTTGHMAYLDSEAALYFRALVRFAHAVNIDIQVTYAYRNWKEQNKLWKEEPNLAAKPGFSDHQSGLSLDIKGCTKTVNGHTVKTQLYYWLKKYAPLFGFENDIPSEGWHWTFLGHPVIK